MDNQYTEAVPVREQLADADDLGHLCKALGHPVRIRIIRHLLDEDRCVCGRIVEILPLAQSTVSQHLKILKEAGLILGEVEGPRTCYCVDRSKLELIAVSLSALLYREPAI